MASLKLFFRRLVIVVAVVLSLTVGAMAVEAAAVWTESAAPLTVAPVSATKLVQRLTDEQGRTAALEDQINALTDQTTQLTAALRDANTRIAQDAKTAKTLRDKLAAAKKKLSALNGGGR
jgi:septal ring factor EnvC (AmiA/AmiB activator)